MPDAAVPPPAPASPAARVPMDSALFRALASLISTAFDATLLALALGGVGALLHHPRAPWLLALWAALGAFLAIARPVSKQDVIEARPDDRVVFLALFFLPMLAPPLAALGERLGLWLLPGGAALRWSGVAISGSGFLLRIVAMMQLGSRFAPVPAIQRDHALETRGLYARLRHPGYLGAWLAALGGALAFGSVLGLIPVILMLPAFALRIRREERLLESRFGDDFRRWRAGTGGMFPRLV